MKMKSMVLFAVAIALGLFAMLGVQEVMSQNANDSEYTQVLVTLTDIAPGVPLDESNVSFKKMPIDAVPEGAVTKQEEYVERALKGAAVAGEFVMVAKLGEKGVFGASSEIPTGMRAVTVSVDPTKTHSGQIQPGDRVDVLVTYKSRTDRGMVNRTKTVLEFIKVFSVDNHRASVAGDSQEMSAKNISLLVTPDNANLLMLAENKGTLHLALRHKTDTEPAKAATIDDSIFDDVETQLGMRDEDLAENNDSQPVKAPDAKSIAEALREELSKRGGPLASPPVSAPAPTKGRKADRETWKIQIYSGEDVRIEEVDLPGEKDETQEEPTKVSALWKTIQGVVSKKSY